MAFFINCNFCYLYWLLFCFVFTFSISYFNLTHLLIVIIFILTSEWHWSGLFMCQCAPLKKPLSLTHSLDMLRYITYWHLVFIACTTSYYVIVWSIIDFMIFLSTYYLWIILLIALIDFHQTFPDNRRLRNLLYWFAWSELNWSKIPEQYLSNNKLCRNFNRRKRQCNTKLLVWVSYSVLYTCNRGPNISVWYKMTLDQTEWNIQ